MDEKKWFLNGKNLDLEHPITEDERDYFFLQLQQKCRSNEAIITLLMTTQEHLNGMNPMQALEKIGAKAIPCILGECEHPDKIQSPAHSLA